ncbi:hypothetical protein C2S51_014841 [Perilla frutescens var. frutescens]|nr:hypothetical protein C2S51_014841 [Perilla frutescens var. frutescens]
MGKFEVTILFFLGAVSAGIWFGASASLNKSSVDESSLLSIKAYINSDILASNWSKEASFCTWTGIICGKKHPERVTSLNLSNMGLRGTIAKEIGNLSFLRFVDISNNSISGPIPGEIGQLRRLRVLKMAFNQLSDALPQSIGLLRKLQEFNLSYNYLSGVIPAGFGNCSKLQKLSLKSNYFTEIEKSKRRWNEGILKAKHVPELVGIPESPEVIDYFDFDQIELDTLY